MTNAELAQLILDRFTPFAFKCECKGTHPDCSSVFNAPSMQAQFGTVIRIANYIETLED